MHSNRIIELPESIGDLLSVVFLDLRANQLTSLLATLSRLICLQELDLISNNLSVLPESIELLADYNKLKALPEAVGKLEPLEVPSVRYNNIGRLPTTMSSLTCLKELNVLAHITLVEVDEFDFNGGRWPLFDCAQCMKDIDIIVTYSDTSGAIRFRTVKFKDLSPSWV
ncbi:plant intracellular Ras-group-related LRR protein 4-like protein [Tanacetum coccineum]